MTTRIKFQQNLDDLKERLLIMAGMAEQAIQRSIEAYRTRDLSICEMVFQSEPLINRLSARSTRWRWTCWRWNNRWRST
jgi:phosphate transport system protein